MSKPESFILNTDFGTLKNDASGSISVTVPASFTITAGALYTATAALTIGTTNANSRVRIASTKESNTFYAGSMLVVLRSGEIPGPFTVPYNIVAYIVRTSPTQITAIAAITNPYIDDLITSSGAETFTFELSTFLSPFL